MHICLNQNLCTGLSSQVFYRSRHTVVCRAAQENQARAYGAKIFTLSIVMLLENS